MNETPRTYRGKLLNTTLEESQTDSPLQFKLLEKIYT